MTTYLVSLGLGKPLQALEFDNLPKFLVAVLVRGTFAITSIAWSKTGFAITMLRLTDGWVKKFIWFLIVTVNISLGISALIQWVACTPLQSSWDPRVPSSTCWPKKTMLAYNLFSGAWSAAADIVLAVLPWQILSQLQMNNREKIGAGIAMSMGLMYVDHFPLPFQGLPIPSPVQLTADDTPSNSAGIVAIVKTTNLNKIYGDDQCKSPRPTQLAVFPANTPAQLMATSSCSGTSPKQASPSSPPPSPRCASSSAKSAAAAPSSAVPAVRIGTPCRI